MGREAFQCISRSQFEKTAALSNSDVTDSAYRVATTEDGLTTAEYGLMTAGYGFMTAEGKHGLTEEGLKARRAEE